MATVLIPRRDMAVIMAAIEVLVERYGHPDHVPLGSLEQTGVPHDTALKCEALLIDEQLPAECASAVAKWRRLIVACCI
jgi:hypothetical protein